MSDLFGAQAGFEKLPISEADVSLLRRIDLENEDQDILQLLMDQTPWQQESVTVWGKTHPQPRLVAWYGDEGVRYTYSGIQLTSRPWTPLLTSLRRKVESHTHNTFNSVLMNLYRNHLDGMGFHSDDERELGERPTIASLSFGEPRTLVFRHRHRKDLRPVRLTLESGSLLLMKGDTQRNWQHGIPKESVPCGPRVNLTFRRIVAATQV